MKKTPLTLIILDGFGYRAEREGNAIAQAEMPYYRELLEKYPHTLIQASGECVGLPPGVMGNSNVGHLVMGAGRVLRTDIELINHEIEAGTFFHNLALHAAMDNAVRRDRALHIMGLVSDGLVHSSQEHAYALLKMANGSERFRMATQSSSSTFALTARGKSPARSLYLASMNFPRRIDRTRTLCVSPCTTRLIRCRSLFRRNRRAIFWPRCLPAWA